MANKDTFALICYNDFTEKLDFSPKINQVPDRLSKSNQFAEQFDSKIIRPLFASEAEELSSASEEAAFGRVLSGLDPDEICGEGVLFSSIRYLGLIKVVSSSMRLSCWSV